MGVESGDGEQTYPGLWFLPVWYRGIPDSMLLLLLNCWCRWEPPLVVSFVFCVRSGCFPVFLAFGALFLRIYFLVFLKSAWSWQFGGNTAGRGLSLVGSDSRCCGGSPLFPVLSFVTVGHWVIGYNGGPNCQP